jgi:hypothetical protein
MWVLMWWQDPEGLVLRVLMMEWGVLVVVVVGVCRAQSASLWEM